MDLWSKQKRSEVMSKIKGKDTKPELILRSELFRHGFRFRVNKKDLPGKPDIVLPKYKIVIFVNGCFWHHHNCIDGKIPKTNIEYWQKKIDRTMKKDKENILELSDLGWKVIVVWECEIERNLTSTFQNILNIIQKFEF